MDSNWPKNIRPRMGRIRTLYHLSDHRITRHKINNLLQRVELDNRFQSRKLWFHNRQMVFINSLKWMILKIGSLLLNFLQFRHKGKLQNPNQGGCHTDNLTLKRQRKINNTSDLWILILFIVNIYLLNLLNSLLLYS